MPFHLYFRLTKGKTLVGKIFNPWSSIFNLSNLYHKKEFHKNTKNKNLVLHLELSKNDIHIYNFAYLIYKHLRLIRTT